MAADMKSTPTIVKAVRNLSFLSEQVQHKSHRMVRLSRGLGSGGQKKKNL